MLNYKLINKTTDKNNNTEERSKWKMIILIILLISSLLYTIYENKFIDVENIKLEVENLSDELKGLKIVHISDVHIPDNGPSIKALVSRVKEQNPDVIVMTGDIVDDDVDNELEPLKELCAGLSNIATTYAISGNHEKRNNNYNSWKSAVEESGVDVIDREIKVFSKNNKEIAFIGVEDQFYDKYKEYDNKVDISNMPKILLAHRPEYFDWYYSENFGVKLDLILSGHAHGGQFRIPFINRGVVAPGQGIFPKLVSGLYENESGGKIVVSRGLGGFPVKINNRVHLPVIELE